jgi:hypothetical protein
MRKTGRRNSEERNSGGSRCFFLRVVEPFDLLVQPTWVVRNKDRVMCDI